MIFGFTEILWKVLWKEPEIGRPQHRFQYRIISLDCYEDLQKAVPMYNISMFGGDSEKGEWSANLPEVLRLSAALLLGRAHKPSGAWSKDVL